MHGFVHEMRKCCIFRCAENPVFCTALILCLARALCFGFMSCVGSCNKNNVIFKNTVACIVICRQEGGGRFPVFGPPLQMQDKLTTKIPIELENFYMFLHEMNSYKQYNEIIQQSQIYLTQNISSPRCADDRSCFRNAFDMHLKCMQIHSINALRAQ